MTPDEILDSILDSYAKYFSSLDLVDTDEGATKEKAVSTLLDDLDPIYEDWRTH